MNNQNYNYNNQMMNNNNQQMMNNNNMMSSNQTNNMNYNMNYNQNMNNNNMMMMNNNNMMMNNQNMNMMNNKNNMNSNMNMMNNNMNNNMMMMTNQNQMMNNNMMMNKQKPQPPPQQKKKKGIYAAEKEIQYPHVPSSLKEFTKLRDERWNMCQTPVDRAFLGMSTYALGLLVYVTKSKDMGIQCITCALEQKLLRKNLQDKNNVKGWVMDRNRHYLRKLDQKPFVIKSYVMGNLSPNPENQYSFDATKPFHFSMFQQNMDSNVKEGSPYKLFIRSTGITPMPMRVRANTRGVFKVLDVYLCFDVKRPKIKDDGDDL